MVAVGRFAIGYLDFSRSCRRAGKVFPTGEEDVEIVRQLRGLRDANKERVYKSLEGTMALWSDTPDMESKLAVLKDAMEY